MRLLLIALLSVQAPPFAHTVSPVTRAQLPQSWRPGCPVPPAQLRRLRLSYWGFDGEPHTGTLVVNTTAVNDLVRVFSRLYAARFPVRRMRPIDAYGGNDERSLAADNTSAFNCRFAVGPGPRRWSTHAYGLAVDVNPVENPYLEGRRVHPRAGRAYLDRTDVRPGMAVRGGLLVRAFSAVDWQWGGRWRGTPDYQHFSATGGGAVTARLYAATGDAIARLDQSGEDWAVELSLEGSGAQCLAVDPAEPDRLYAGLREGGVRRSDDGGRAWVDCALPEPGVFSLSVSVVDGAVYAGTEPSRLFRSGDGGESWRALDGLLELPSRPTWSFPPRPWTSHVRWIAPRPHEVDLLLVGIELGGLMRSTDGGERWQDHRPGAQPDVHSLAWHPRAAGRAYEAGGGGSAWSDDAGDTWHPADDGRDRNYTWSVAVDPEDPECWYVSASTGPFAAHGGRDPQAQIYRRRDGGPWQVLGGGLPDPLPAMPYALVAPDGRLFAGLADGQLWESGDQGDTWRACTLRGDALPRLNALGFTAFS